MNIVQPLAFFALAAACELAGCFAFWAWLRLGHSPFLALPGMLCLAVFAWALTRIDTPFAGRAYAVYGGIYIAGAVLWLRLVEGATPDRWDLVGALLCFAGALLILLGPR
jgi:small multidrug resistance family-3 protein